MLGVIPAIRGKRIDWSLELLLGRAPLAQVVCFTWQIKGKKWEKPKKKHRSS